MQRALLISLVAVSYLLFAGGPRWTLGPLLLIAIAGVLVAPARTLRFPAAWRRLDLALAAIVLGILIQLIPLPGPVLQYLSPHALELHRSMRFSALGSTAPGWASLTIDPEATAYALGTVVLGILSFLIARALFGAGGSSRKFCRAIAVFGAAAALAAMVQRIAAPTLVLGILQPAAQSTKPFGAFTNRNHFAAWLLMIATVACGYLIAHLRIHPFQRGRALLKQLLSTGALPTAAAAFITVGALFITLSRSAVAGLGAAGIAGWRLGRPRMQIERTSLPIILGAAGVAILMFVLFIDVDRWAARFEQSLNPVVPGAGFSRMDIWRESLPIIKDFPLAGTGAGTYSDAMTNYQQTRVWVGSMRRWAHFNNAHSHYVPAGQRRRACCVAVPGALSPSDFS